MHVYEARIWNGMLGAAATRFPRKRVVRVVEFSLLSACASHMRITFCSTNVRFALSGFYSHLLPSSEHGQSTFESLERFFPSLSSEEYRHAARKRLGFTLVFGAGRRRPTGIWGKMIMKKEREKNSFIDLPFFGGSTRFSGEIGTSGCIVSNGFFFTLKLPPKTPHTHCWKKRWRKLDNFGISWDGVRTLGSVQTEITTFLQSIHCSRIFVRIARGREIITVLKVFGRGKRDLTVHFLPSSIRTWWQTNPEACFVLRPLRHYT